MHKWFIPALLVIFFLISVVTLKSVAEPLAYQQVLFYGLGTILFLLAAIVPLAVWYRLRWLAYATLIFLLALTLALGTVTRGTRSWIEVGNYHIQPSQLAIPVVALVAGWYLTHQDLATWRSTSIFLGIILLPAMFILSEPDLGTTLIYLVSLGALLLIVRTPRFFLPLMIGGGLSLIMVAWLFFLKPYQKDRITSFLNPQAADSAAYYNAQQSLIAVGSGQLLGRGLGQGVQSHLRFLPERQTDFIFASLAEEWGFLGASLLISMYLALSLYLILLSYSKPNTPEYYYCFILGMMLAAQSLVNIGMNVGLLPITGITLPFISYGGSSLLSLCIAMGLAYNIVLHQPARHTTKHFS